MRVRSIRLLVAVVLLASFAAIASAADPVPSAARDVGAATSAAGGEPAGPSTMAQFRIRPVDDAWRAALPRDADAATKAYLDRLPADVVARSNAYFEGGYWLQLWNLLLGLVIAVVLISGRRSARLREWCGRVGHKAFLRDALYGALYAMAAWLLSLPLTIYQGYVREHAYAMATQTFGPWFAEQLIGLVVSMVSIALVASVFYAVLRRVGERWWLWGTVVAVGFLVLDALVAPVLIEPLFNTYKPVADGPVRQAVLAMAHANGVPADDIYEVDASRQSTRVSASVSGIFGSAAVRLNDNLLRRSSLPEIRATMGHELGHYVLHHIYKRIGAMALLLLAAFGLTQWAMTRLLARFGTRFGLHGASDVAAFPLFLAVLSVVGFIGMPLTNGIVRIQEIEADRFGLNLAREPHGEAEVDLKLTEYRKPDPSPLEEFVFFDHPSTRFRVHDAMRWREAMGTP